jgi:hypothetical protein
MKAPRGGQRRGERACRPSTPHTAVSSVMSHVLSWLSPRGWGGTPRRCAHEGCLSSEGGAYGARVSLPSLLHAGTAEPLLVSPPEAVAYLLELHSWPVGAPALSLRTRFGRVLSARVTGATGRCPSTACGLVGLVP